MSFDFTAILTGLHEFVPRRPNQLGDRCPKLMSVMLDCEGARDGLDGDRLAPHFARVKVPVRERPRIPAFREVTAAPSAALYRIPLRGVKLTFEIDGTVPVLELDPDTLRLPKLDEILPSGRDYRLDSSLLGEAPRDVAAQVVIDKGRVLTRPPSVEFGVDTVPPRAYDLETVWTVRDVKAVTLRLAPFTNPSNVQSHTIVAPTESEVLIEITNECDHTPQPGEVGDPDFRWHFEALRASDKSNWRAQLQTSGEKLPYPKPLPSGTILFPPCLSALWPMADY